MPGSEGLIDDEAEALQTAHEIGFPVLIKATAGGGGKGMRVASNDLALKAAVAQASVEAQAAGTASRTARSASGRDCPLPHQASVAAPGHEPS